MDAAEGFLTAFGGMTTHAALVARQMGKVAIVGCEALTFDYQARTMTVATATADRACSTRATGSRSTASPARSSRARLDTSPSEVVQVLIEKTPRRQRTRPVYRQFARLLGWADEVRRLKVRANADQPDQADDRRRLRRAGDRPVPHRAHVLRRGEDRPDARDDRGREPRPSGARRWPSSCRCSGPTSPASSAPWRRGR